MLRKIFLNTDNNTHNDHRNGKVRPQLIIRPVLRRSVTVFEYTSSMDQIGFRLVLCRNLIYVKVLFEIYLNSVGPLLVTPSYCLAYSSCIIIIRKKCKVNNV